MLPCFDPNKPWTPSPDDLRFLTTPSAVYPTGWPGLPATKHYQEPVSRSEHRVMDFPAMLVLPQLLPPSVMPFHNHSFFEHYYANESRKDVLHRSVFDLVGAHHCLPLTDTELLRWYLCLSPEDRRIILDEGGFHHFLQSHPGLELSEGHVYVKQTSLPMSEQENLTPVGNSNSVNGSQPEEICNNPTVHQQPYNLPLTFTQNQHKGPSFSQLNSSSVSAAVSLDMELERFTQRRKPVFWSRDFTIQADSDPPTASCEPLNVKSMAEKSPFTIPCAPSCDATTNTETERCTSNHTQTEGSKTAEQHIMTELQMNDLDCLAEELIKLKMLQEWKEPQEKIERKDCNCKQRAQQAELSLLTLQYELCRQHVWRLYDTSNEGHLPLTIAKDPPSNILRILQKLETDYKLMKHQILMGVPLEQLRPLCVEFEKITTGACYIPVQIIGDVVGIAPSWTAQGTQKHEGAEDIGCLDDEGSWQKTKLVKKENEEVRRATALVPKDRFVKKITCESVNISEVWYDAVEELQLPGPAAAAEICPNSDMTDSMTSSKVCFPSTSEACEAMTSSGYAR
ncbi:RNA-binding protein 44 isoform X3 [Girardinichthys multiradiatus]|uniref:RNA-binding protein 44 isoform X3 n=1 Tax=Girardinichthys multiradiatus TaxID=208333 RepID=UPI001FAD429F|nr:RNA-binding protein 44 isoform X3 [Girardinichthys multiradiatus]